MRPGYDESPVNPVPAVVWLLALPIIASEVYFGLGRLGFLAGGTGAGSVARQIMVERTAFAPEFLIRAWGRRSIEGAELWRLLAYPFVHYSLTHAVFVTVFLLALGNMVARAMRPLAVAVLFIASAVGAGIVYALVAALLPGLRFDALVGGYPAVYGLLGAFTFLLWTRLGQEHANQLRAFSLIGIMLAFQLVFGILFGSSGKNWIGEVTGFAIGFLLSFVLAPGGLSRLRRTIRHR
ncbi:rhomboid family intramembrane serine protease [Paracoccus contaminans]|uniref:Rhomboid family intramembrane serine protease n=1 Tax=Paracoccus contaminans TaxID=1945662 RepID=A0A1W6CX48_9RHOB|nr:rhomboid family intramembrane serine protease [Paracoccus contaminans]ARJ69442.1 rhomboid family intramembrane serine protease [Paracoccus contaminans]